MKFLILATVMSCASLISYGQVGINTQLPQALLDIEVSDPSAPDATDGILIPRVSAFPAVDPDASQDGMLVYLTTTTGNSTPGFYYWNGAITQWCKLMTENAMMMCSIAGIGLGASGTIFNFDNIRFSSIQGANFVGNELMLPPGVYEIESDLRLNPNVAIEWNMRLNGTIYPGSIPGSSVSAVALLNTSTNPQRAIVTITSTSGGIDFEVTNGLGASLISDCSYLKITKLQ
ncbi:hypothetical protein FNJ87_05340 [Nonlabens mediterrranea]|uniref:Uncharacterized protein n=1 Tax=Nonlabens mediterrranea TaxID=1419947 RepID=A0ABS0A345_9FLAO|nr:hypothetical protein [Nonlabens mediterrranea]